MPKSPAGGLYWRLRGQCLRGSGREGNSESFFSRVARARFYAKGVPCSHAHLAKVELIVVYGKVTRI